MPNDPVDEQTTAKQGHTSENAKPVALSAKEIGALLAKKGVSTAAISKQLRSLPRSLSVTNGGNSASASANNDSIKSRSLYVATETNEKPCSKKNQDNSNTSQMLKKSLENLYKLSEKLKGFKEELDNVLNSLYRFQHKYSEEKDRLSKSMKETVRNSLHAFNDILMDDILDDHAADEDCEEDPGAVLVTVEGDLSASERKELEDALGTFAKDDETPKAASGTLAKDEDIPKAPLEEAVLVEDGDVTILEEEPCEDDAEI